MGSGELILESSSYPQWMTFNQHVWAECMFFTSTCLGGIQTLTLQKLLYLQVFGI